MVMHVLTPVFRSLKTFKELSLSFLHVSCTEISKLVSFGRAYRYARGTGEGTSQAEVPSPEGPLAIWCFGQLGRVVRI